MAQNRWVTDPNGDGGPLGKGVPSLPNLEVAYLTDPATLAAVLPPPLTAPDVPRVHIRITDIDFPLPGGGRWKEHVGYIAVDAFYEGTLGEYPLLIPIDHEPAISISREKFGEPKKLAEIELTREGAHVAGSITSHGVTYVEIAGDVVETLETPAPYEAHQWWFKFLPAVSGRGFDAGPLLVRMDQVRKPESVERVEGKLVLRDFAGAPVVDLPVLETESIRWTRRASDNVTSVVGPVDPVAFAPFAGARYS